MKFNLLNIIQLYIYIYIYIYMQIEKLSVLIIKINGNTLV